jgi:flotillin
MPGSDIYLIVAVIAFVLVNVSAVVVIASRYKRCPSDMILVVMGKVPGDKPFRCIHGGGVLIWPLIQDYRFIPLAPITVPVSLQNVPTSSGDCVDMSGSFTTGVSTRPGVMETAAERLLSLTSREIEALAEEIYLTHLRLLVRSLSFEQIEKDRKGFLYEIRNRVGPELNKIGLYLININITDIYECSD